VWARNTLRRDGFCHRDVVREVECGSQRSSSGEGPVEAVLTKTLNELVLLVARESSDPSGLVDE
jgi:hypothetical protein